MGKKSGWCSGDQEMTEYDIIEHTDGTTTKIKHITEEEHKIMKQHHESVQYIHEQHIKAEKEAKHWKYACSLCRKEERER